MKLLFLNGSRGEWGYIRPIIRRCMARDIDYSIVATNMLLLPNYGSLVDEIKAEGFAVSDELFMSLEGHNHHTTVKSMAVLLNSLADVLYRVKPTWLILAGDRGEQLMGAIAASYTYTPVAHIQAGERSGNIDGVARHAIGKFVHLHFAANQDAADRLHRLGEEPFRIHNVGAPQLDEMLEGHVTPPAELFDKFNIDAGQPFLLVVQHPVTEEMDRASAQAAALMAALRQLPMPKVWVLPNNDAGASSLRRVLAQLRTADTYAFENLSRPDYLGFMNACAAMVGNSSSGLLEAPTFRKAAVNLGRRQADRVQGANVINAPFEETDIVAAIHRALSEEFQASLKDCLNPYGDGRSSERILDILEGTPVTDRLLVKELTY